jgi:hypothetical protein
MLFSVLVLSVLNQATCNSDRGNCINHFVRGCGRWPCAGHVEVNGQCVRQAAWLEFWQSVRSSQSLPLNELLMLTISWNELSKCEIWAAYSGRRCELPVVLESRAVPTVKLHFSSESSRIPSVLVQHCTYLHKKPTNASKLSLYCDA